MPTGLAQNLSFILLGEDKSASKTMTGAQATAEKVTGRIGSAFSKVGGIIGGEFGGVLDEVGAKIGDLGEKGAKLSTTLEVGGGIATAAGVALMQLGSGAQQAQAQLSAAVSASGDSIEDYSKQIEEAVANGEKFGKSAIDTKQALTTLTTSTGSVQTALEQMNTVTDLAAAKHISLASAATLVARVMAGSGGKTLTQYGIQMDGVGTKTDQGQRALDQLSGKLNGQATASVDNFSGHVAAMTTTVTDWVEEVAGPAGAALSGFGPIVSAAGIAINLYQSFQKKRLATDAASTIAATENAAATTAEGAAAGAAAPEVAALGAAEGGAAVSGTAAAGSLGSIAAAAGPVTVGIAGMLGELAGVTAAASGIADLAQQTKTLQQYTDAANTSASELGKTLGGSTGLFSGHTFKDFVTQTGTGAGGAAGFSFDTQRNLKNSAAGAFVPVDPTVGEAGKADTALASLSSAELASTYKDLAAQATAAGAGAGYMADVFPKATAALKTQGTAASVAASNTASIAPAADTSKAAIAALATEMASFGKVTQDVRGASRDYAAAVDAATAALKTNGATHDVNTSKGRANQAAVDAIASSTEAYASALETSGASQNKVSAELASGRSAYIKAAEAIGYTKDQAKALADKLIELPSSRHLTFSSSGIPLILSQIDLIRTHLTKLPATIPGHAALTLSGVLASPRASGGRVRYGETTLVGEDGPEVAQFPAGTMISPNGSRRMSGDGGVTVVVNVQGSVHSVPSLAKAVQEVFEKGIPAGTISAKRIKTALGIAS